MYNMAENNAKKNVTGVLLHFSFPKKVVSPSFAIKCQQKWRLKME